MPETCPPLDISRLARALHESALLMNVAANPRRLQILYELTSGARTLRQVCESLTLERRSLSHHLQVLVQAALIASSREENQRSYQLTEAGAKLLHTAGMLDGRQVTGAASRSPEAADSPAEDGLERMLALLRIFADPVRLRLLNLLAGDSEVCVCHLHKALDLPQSTVSRHLTQLRDARLIVGRREGTWIYYRLAHAAGGLHGILIGQIDPKIAHGGVFEADLDRLEGLTSCQKSDDK